VATDLGKRTMDAIREQIVELREAEHELLQERLARRDASLRSALIATIALGCGSLLIFVTVIALLERTTRRRMRAERAALESGERLRVTLQSIGDAVIATDLQGAVVYLNPVAQALTGWRQAEAVGLPVEQVFRIVNEFSRDIVESPVSKVLREGKVVGLANHTVLIGRDASERPIDDSGAPIRDADGELMGVVLVFRDVSARRLSEQSRERLFRAEAERDSAESANRIKDEFLAVVSHELRSPLTAALSWIELQREGVLDTAQQTRAVDTIERNLRRQALLIDDLLDVSRTVAGKLSVEHVPFDAGAVIRTEVDDIRGQADAKGLTLRLESEGGMLLALGDPVRFAQVAMNVLSNAIKFTPAGGTVAARIGAREGAIQLEIRDDGAGIAPEFLPHVFERFRQATSGILRGTQGLGLGLSIARDLVELQGGTISAESAGLGHGATFRISLPAADASAPAVVWRPSHVPVSPRLAGARVLLVEDEEDLRVSLGHRLRRRGLDVTEAHSAAEALRLASAERPAIVLSDIGLPGESGFELIRVLRERDAASGGHTPAIAVSGYASAQDRSQALAAGFDAHMAKPVDFDELLSVMSTLLERVGTRS
ncbi:MAG: ATP-binding protein, partial [Myxococcota bacterium]